MVMFKAPIIENTEDLTGDETIIMHDEHGVVQVPIELLDNEKVYEESAKIKASYEANDDTNAFTDSEKLKLSTIADGADVSYDAATGAEITAGTLDNKLVTPKGLGDSDYIHEIAGEVSINSGVAEDKLVTPKYLKLSHYITEPEMTTALADKVDKDGSKVLSDNNYTNSAKNVVDSIKPNFDLGMNLSKNNYTDAAKAVVDSTNANLANKVDIVSGKGLSTNDYTDSEKSQLATINAHYVSETQLNSSLQGKVDKDGEKVLSDNNYTDSAKAVVDGIFQGDYNGQALSDNNYTDIDQNIVDQVTNNLAGKVDKVEGKGLSTNDYTDSDKSKLLTIENNYVSQNEFNTSYLRNMKRLELNHHIEPVTFFDLDVNIHKYSNLIRTVDEVGLGIGDYVLDKTGSVDNMLAVMPNADIAVNNVILDGNENHSINFTGDFYFVENRVPQKPVITEYNKLSNMNLICACVFRPTSPFSTNESVVNFFDSTASNNNDMNRFGFFLNVGGDNKVTLTTHLGGLNDGGPNTEVIPNQVNIVILTQAKQSSGPWNLKCYLNGNKIEDEDFDTVNIKSADTFIIGADLDVGDVIKNYFTGHLYRVILMATPFYYQTITPEKLNTYLYELYVS